VLPSTVRAVHPTAEGGARLPIVHGVLRKDAAPGNPDDEILELIKAGVAPILAWYAGRLEEVAAVPPEDSQSASDGDAANTGIITAEDGLLRRGRRWVMPCGEALVIGRHSHQLCPTIPCDNGQMVTVAYTSCFSYSCTYHTSFSSDTAVLSPWPPWAAPLPPRVLVASSS
jgi:hypothetical protein